MDKPDPAVGWDCYDDEGEKIAWFLHFDDAVLWLAERERAGDPQQSQADPAAERRG